FILHHEKLLDLKNPDLKGLDLAIHSTIPMGAGLASSAALEVVTMLNLWDHFQIGYDASERLRHPLWIAHLCQQVENDIVGAPCGIMDQMTSLRGEKDKLFRLDCRHAHVQAPIPIPAGVRFVGIDSGVRHSLASPSQYELTRCAGGDGNGSLN